MLEYDGYEAWSDLSHLSADELHHHIIDGFIHLAKINGISVLEEVMGCAKGLFHSQLESGKIYV